MPVDLEDQEESFFPSLAVVTCQELIAHGHIPPLTRYLALLFRILIVARAPRLKPTEDKRAVLTSITVDGDTGADGAALADAVRQLAVGDTLVILANTLWKRHTAMSADAPEGEAGRRLTPRARRGATAAPHPQPPRGSSVGRELSPRSPRTGSGPFLLLGTPNRGESRRGRGTRQTGHPPARGQPLPQRGRHFVALPGAGRSGAPTAPVRGGGSAGNERGRPQWGRGPRLGLAGKAWGETRGAGQALTVLGAGSGAEQQQERSPAERLHGFGRRWGAERPGRKPRRSGFREKEGERALLARRGAM